MGHPSFSGWTRSALVLSGLIAVMFAAPGNATAQQAKPWEQIPIPKLHDFKPQQPKRIELKNGIVVFLQEDHELPFISGSVLIPGGSRDEDPAKAGLVGLYGQAWRTSGTAKMGGDAMDDLLEAKAAHIETGGRRRFDRALVGFAEGRRRPGLFAGDGPAFSSQVQRGEARAGAAAGSDGHRAAQRRRRRDRGARDRPSWCTAPTAPIRGSRSWPRLAR